MTAPVAAVHPLSIFLIRLAVGEIQSIHRIRIEIVIHMDGVKVVARNQVFDHTLNKSAVFRQAWIEIKFAVVSDETLGMLVIDMIFRKFLIFRCCHTIRVKPCVKLHAARMRFLNHKLQRVPIRRRGLAGSASQETAPRLQFRRIEGVGARTHLEKHGVAACGFKFVELVAEVCLCLICCHFGILALMHCVDPCSTEFLFRIFGMRHRQRQHRRAQSRQNFFLHSNKICLFVDLPTKLQRIAGICKF